jgi:outer membrane protein OmpA-like peptidoglycan-associated protein
MSTSVLALAKDLLTPELIGKASLFTGESGETTQSALHALVPAVLSAFADKASTTDGATGLFHLLSSLPALNAGDVAGWVKAGKPLLSLLFGDRVGGLVDSITNATGIREGGATALAGLASSLVASVLAGKAQRSDPTALAELLAHEKGAALAVAPAGVTSVLESGGLGFRHLVPMILTGAMMLAIPLLYRSCDKHEAPAAAVAVKHEEPKKVEEPKAEKIELPGGVAINVLPGTINYELAKFLASSEPVPRTFVFDHLNFESGTTVITKESEATLTDLLAILKAYPAVDSRLEGHTDSVGQPAANKKLSEDRAAAIESYLVKSGIDTKRITTAGYGQEKPLASNDTDDGRAKNRRLELVVVKK